VFRSAWLPKWVLVALTASLAVVAMATAALAWVSREPALPRFGPMPSFRLVDQAGNPVTEADVKGKVLAVGFIYTSCTDICPMLTTVMATLQDQLRREGLLGEDVLLLSISVDPERDTPEVLARYAREHGADTATWRFLTGDPDHIRSVVVEGFSLGLTKTDAHAHHSGAEAVQAYEVEHSGRVVLVDPVGQIRAYYEGTELDPARVAAEIRRLR